MNEIRTCMLIDDCLENDPISNLCFKLKTLAFLLNFKTIKKK